MARFLLPALLILGCVASLQADFHCSNVNGDSTGFPKEVCYTDRCTTAIKNHIKHEFHAAFLYMHMGAYFAQDTIARPGMAKFMLESASEERSHAILMLDYLNKRGVKITQEESFSFNKENISEEQKKEGLNVKTALQEALKMEIGVTDMIYNVVNECEHDFHGADVFTNPILDEQHEGIRKLQGAVQEYSNLLHGHNTTDGIAMVDFIFDQKILKESL